VGSLCRNRVRAGEARIVCGGWGCVIVSGGWIGRKGLRGCWRRRYVFIFSGGVVGWVRMISGADFDLLGLAEWRSESDSDVVYVREDDL
jgi:hypothetical protein